MLKPVFESTPANEWAELIFSNGDGVASCTFGCYIFSFVADMIADVILARRLLRAAPWEPTIAALVESFYASFSSQPSRRAFKRWMYSLVLAVVTKMNGGQPLSGGDRIEFPMRARCLKSSWTAIKVTNVAAHFELPKASASGSPSSRPSQLFSVFEKPSQLLLQRIALPLIDVVQRLIMPTTMAVAEIVAQASVVLEKGEAIGRGMAMEAAAGATGRGRNVADVDLSRGKGRAAKLRGTGTGVDSPLGSEERAATGSSSSSLVLQDALDAVFGVVVGEDGVGDRDRDRACFQADSGAFQCLRAMKQVQQQLCGTGSDAISKLLASSRSQLFIYLEAGASDDFFFKVISARLPARAIQVVFRGKSTRVILKHQPLPDPPDRHERTDDESAVDAAMGSCSSSSKTVAQRAQLMQDDDEQGVQEIDDQADSEDLRAVYVDAGTAPAAEVSLDGGARELKAREQEADDESQQDRVQSSSLPARAKTVLLSTIFGVIFSRLTLPTKQSDSVADDGQHAHVDDELIESVLIDYASMNNADLSKVKYRLGRSCGALYGHLERVIDALLITPTLSQSATQLLARAKRPQTLKAALSAHKKQPTKRPSSKRAAEQWLKGQALLEVAAATRQWVYAACQRCCGNRVMLFSADASCVAALPVVMHYDEQTHNVRVHRAPDVNEFHFAASEWSGALAPHTEKLRRQERRYYSNIYDDGGIGGLAALTFDPTQSRTKEWMEECFHNLLDPTRTLLESQSSTLSSGDPGAMVDDEVDRETAAVHKAPEIAASNSFTRAIVPRAIAFLKRMGIEFVTRQTRSAVHSGTLAVAKACKQRGQESLADRLCAAAGGVQRYDVAFGMFDTMSTRAPAYKPASSSKKRKKPGGSGRSSSLLPKGPNTALENLAAQQQSPALLSATQAAEQAATLEAAAVRQSGGDAQEARPHSSLARTGRTRRRSPALANPAYLETELARRLDHVPKVNIALRAYNTAYGRAIADNVKGKGRVPRQHRSPTQRNELTSTAHSSSHSQSVENARIRVGAVAKSFWRQQRRFKKIFTLTRQELSVLTTTSSRSGGGGGAARTLPAASTIAAELEASATAAATPTSARKVCPTHVVSATNRHAKSSLSVCNTCGLVAWQSQVACAQLCSVALRLASMAAPTRVPPSTSSQSVT